MDDDLDICGHVHYDEPPLILRMEAEAQRARQRKYWIGPGKFADITREDTVQRIQRSFLWAEQFSNTRFIQVDRERDALHKIYFESAARVGQIVGDGKSYYAVQWPANSWHFNRDIKVAHRRQYSVEAVNLHEFGHALKMKHTLGEKDLMHAGVRGWYPTAQEIIAFQKKLGKSPGFWPIPQQLAGQELRDTIEQREQLIAERTALQIERQQSNDAARRAAITDTIRSILTPQIQRLNQDVARLTNEWQAIREAYKIVPGSR